MFDGSVDVAILAGPLALHRAKWPYIGQSGFNGLVMRLPVVAGCGAVPRRFCPIATGASRVFCFGQHELSGGAASWHRHCPIPQAVLGIQPAPALFPGTQGSMTGSRSHDPVTVVTAPEHPGWSCWHRPCRPIPARVFAPSTVVI
ncbi:MAG: hypothetical protein GDA36_01870 [Rhodobacteraceae bacterium]|nr:hypothetical protein [Paracoccaceae bacterium]